MDLHATIYPGFPQTGVMPVLFSNGLRWLWWSKATLRPERAAPTASATAH